jgi:hypothetical protein
MPIHHPPQPDIQSTTHRQSRLCAGRGLLAAAQALETNAAVTADTNTGAGGARNTGHTELAVAGEGNGGGGAAGPQWSVRQHVEELHRWLTASTDAVTVEEAKERVKSFEAASSFVSVARRCDLDTLLNVCLCAKLGCIKAWRMRGGGGKELVPTGAWGLWRLHFLAPGSVCW